MLFQSYNLPSIPDWTCVQIKTSENISSKCRDNLLTDSMKLYENVILTVPNNVEVKSFYSVVNSTVYIGSLDSDSDCLLFIKLNNEPLEAITLSGYNTHSHKQIEMNLVAEKTYTNDLKANAEIQYIRYSIKTDNSLIDMRPTIDECECDCDYNCNYQTDIYIKLPKPTSPLRRQIACTTPTSMTSPNEMRD
jgi:hypothetical protein